MCGWNHLEEIWRGRRLGVGIVYFSGSDLYWKGTNPELLHQLQQVSVQCDYEQTQPGGGLNKSWNWRPKATSCLDVPLITDGWCLSDTVVSEDQFLMSWVASLDYSRLFLEFSGSALQTRLIFYHTLNLDCCVTNAGPCICLIFSSVWKKFEFPYVQHSNLSVCGLFFSSDGLSETKTPQLCSLSKGPGVDLIHVQGDTSPYSG